MRTINCIMAIALFASFANAEDEGSDLPLISVKGISEINVAPDEIQISFTIDNREKTLPEARSKTDEQARKILSLAKDNQIKPEDIITSYVEISPVRDYRKNEGRTIIYFRAAQNISITLRDFTKYDAFINSLLNQDSGVTTTVVYSLSDMPRYRKEARINAIRAAQEKAKLLAEAVGQKIGKAHSIQEAAENYQNPLSNRIQIITKSGGSDDSDTASPLSNGKIIVKASVEVSFLLE